MQTLKHLSCITSSIKQTKTSNKNYSIFKNTVQVNKDSCTEKDEGTSSIRQDLAVFVTFERKLL